MTNTYVTQLHMSSFTKCAFCIVTCIALCLPSTSFAQRRQKPGAPPLSLPTQISKKPTLRFTAPRTEKDLPPVGEPFVVKVNLNRTKNICMWFGPLLFNLFVDQSLGHHSQVIHTADILYSPQKKKIILLSLCCLANQPIHTCFIRIGKNRAHTLSYFFFTFLVIVTWA